MKETILFFGNYGQKLFGVIMATQGEHKVYKDWWWGVNPTVSVRVAKPEDAELLRRFAEAAMQPGEAARNGPGIDVPNPGYDGGPLIDSCGGR